MAPKEGVGRWRLGTRLLAVALALGCAAAPVSAAPLRLPVLSSEGELVLHWTPPPPGPPVALTSVAFQDALTGFGVTAKGGIYRTSDGGVSWQEVAHFSQVHFDRLLFPNAAEALALGTDAGQRLTAWISRDGGRHWQACRLSGVPPAAEGDFPNFSFAFIGHAVYAAPHPPLTPKAPLHLLLRSTDGGCHWQSLPLPRGVVLTGGIAFPSQKDGFLTAKQGSTYLLLATSDGGRHWQTRLSSSIPLTALAFPTPSTGYLGGGFSPYSSRTPRQLVLWSADGGRHWQLRYEAQRSGVNLDAFFFGEGTEGYATTGPCPIGALLPCTAPLLFTRDGGRHWHVVSGADRVLFPSVVGNDAFYVTNPWPFGPNVAILHDLWDGGEVRLVPRQPAALLASNLQMVGASWLLTSNAGVFFSADNGHSWRRLILAAPAVRTATLLLAGPHTLLDLSAPSVLRSDDLGRSWQAVRLPLHYASLANLLPEAWAMDGGRVFLLIDTPKEGGVLLRSDDAGRTWRILKRQLPADLVTSLSMHGRFGVLVGSRPYVLLRSVDGGSVWRNWVRLPRQFYVTGVDCLSPQDVWLIGEIRGHFRSSGFLLHTRDGGAHWQLRRFPTGQLLGIRFQNSREGWLLAEDGLHPGDLFHTVDGGRTFQEVWPNILPQAQKSGGSASGRG